MRKLLFIPLLFIASYCFGGDSSFNLSQTITSNNNTFTGDNTFEGTDTFSDFNTSDDGIFKLIYSTTVPTAAASVTISGLSGDTDKNYIVRISSVSIAAGYMQLGFNGDTGSNYGYAYLSAGNTDNNSESTSNDEIHIGYQEGMGYFYIEIDALSGKYRHAHGRGIRTADGSLSVASGWWTNTADEITSMTFSHSAANISAGTIIEIWARR